MNAVKVALDTLVTKLAVDNVGVNIGLARGRNNGSDTANGAAKGGFIALDVTPIITSIRRRSLVFRIGPRTSS